MRETVGVGEGEVGGFLDGGRCAQQYRWPGSGGQYVEE